MPYRSSNRAPACTRDGGRRKAGTSLRSGARPQAGSYHKPSHFVRCLFSAGSLPQAAATGHCLQPCASASGAHRQVEQPASGVARAPSTGRARTRQLLPALHDRQRAGGAAADGQAQPRGGAPRGRLLLRAHLVVGAQQIRVHRGHAHEHRDGVVLALRRRIRVGLWPTLYPLNPLPHARRCCASAACGAGRGHGHVGGSTFLPPCPAALFMPPTPWAMSSAGACKEGGLRTVSWKPRERAAHACRLTRPCMMPLIE